MTAYKGHIAAGLALLGRGSPLSILIHATEP